MPQMTAAFHTLGCKTNHYETEALRKQFAEAGFIEVPFGQAADVSLINTCTVTGEAGRKSRQMIRRARKANPQAVVVALGCHSELDQSGLDADIIIGTSGKSQALNQVLNLMADEDRDKLLLLETDPQAYEDLGLVDSQSETRAYIKVEDGCNNFCAYCTIPLARGRVRSRPEEQILAEAKALAAAGYREIVLTGIHVCSYGTDLGRPSYAVMELAKKLGQIDQLKRIRLGSLEPQSVTEQFVELAMQNPKVLPHFHLSLQSGSDTVLQRMGRHYLTQDYRRVVQRLRLAYDNPGITTDIIVGFPGESDEEHAESLAFCREIGFSRLHVFRYSRRDGTRAAAMKGQISPAVIAARSQDLLAAADEMALAYHRTQVGRQQAVLLEKERPDGLFEGYSPEYVPVRVEPKPGYLPGQVVQVNSIEASTGFLLCR